MAGDGRDPEGDDTGEGGDVGYGRPPKSGRFRKGRSGNPAGKPKGARNRPRPEGERLRALMLAEAYRPVKRKVDGVEVTMPLAQAVLRSLAEAAAKGEARAQAIFFKMVSAGEAEEAAMEEISEEARAPDKPVIQVRVVDAIDGHPAGAREVAYSYGGGTEVKGGKTPSTG